MTLFDGEQEFPDFYGVNDDYLAEAEDYAIEQIDSALARMRRQALGLDD